MFHSFQEAFADFARASICLSLTSVQCIVITLWLLSSLGQVVDRNIRKFAFVDYWCTKPPLLTCEHFSADEINELRCTQLVNCLENLNVTLLLVPVQLI